MGNEVFSEFAVCSLLPVVYFTESQHVYLTSLISLYFFLWGCMSGTEGGRFFTWSVVGEFVAFEICTCTWDTRGYKGPCYITLRVIHFFFIISKIIFFFLGY